MKSTSSVASRPRARIAALAVLLAAGASAALLAGCGQKGPLTLPAKPASAASAPASR